MIRTLFYYKNYFEDFIEKQTLKVKKKIFWVLGIIENERFIPETYFKPIREGIYEIRVQNGNNKFRIFCFFDSDKLVILMNGFQKKTQKIPIKEIEIAIKIKKEYENEKSNTNRRT
jgi:Phage-related protein